MVETGVITKIKRLRPRSGDVLVLYSDRLTSEQASRLSERLETLGLSGLSLFVLGTDEDLGRLDDHRLRDLYDRLRERFEPSA